MAINYTWKITGLKTKDEVKNGTTFKNAVVQTYWQLKGTDEKGHSGTFTGATPFTANPSDSSGPFIPFEQLTEANVISWIQSVVVGSYQEHVYGKIQEQIDDSITPVVESQMPWAPVEPINPEPLAPAPEA